MLAILFKIAAVAAAYVLICLLAYYAAFEEREK